MTLIPDWLGVDIPDVVMDDAATWLAILDSEQCNVADRAAFAQWLDEDPVHRWAFEELSEVWAKLRTLNDVEPLLQQPNVVPIAPERMVPQSLSPPEITSRSDFSTLAVVALIAIGVLMHLFQTPPTEEIVTGIGESREVTLSDGSLLELNSKTELVVSIDEQKRHIQMIDGEAVFHVANNDRPFVVETRLGDVTALGTSFAVEIAAGKLEVSVIEGQVSVAVSGDEIPLIEFDEIDGYQFTRDALLLGPGDWLEVSNSASRRQELGTEEFRKRLAWRNGNVIFEDQPLRVVIEEMRRYTDVSIHIADSELSDLPVSGLYRTGDIKQFLAQLRQDYPLLVDDSGSGWIVLRAK